MKEYIENVLHQDIQIVPYEEAQRLPLALKGGFRFFLMSINGQDVLVATPAQKSSLPELRKQQRQLEVYTGLPCVLYLREMNYYSRDVMIREGIPFVWEGHQIYLPFIGMLINENKRQAVKTCSRISYLTQKLLLMALYQSWNRVTVTKAAELLGVSKMSVTRCFDELEALDVSYLTIRSRARNITADPDKKAMWEQIRPILRNPVIAVYTLNERPDIELPMAGTMALSHYSMLDEGRYPILAVTKKKLAEIRISGNMLTPAGEDPRCIIQEIGYQISFENGIAVDPLTVALSLSEEELSDPRLSMAVDEMLKEYVW